MSSKVVNKQKRFHPKKIKVSKKFKTAVRREIKSTISRTAEKKYHRLAVAGSGYDYGGVVVSLSDVPAGTTDLTRVGDSLSIRSIRVMGKILSADTTNTYRIIVFQWLDDQTPTPANVLSSVYVGTVNGVNSPYYHDQRKKFRVLWDKRFNVDNVSHAQQLFDTKHLFPSTKKISFNAGGTTGNAKIYMLLISDSGAAPHPTLDFVSQLSYNDL